jgi:hypothetical protein
LWDSNNRLKLGISFCAVGSIGLLCLVWGHWSKYDWLLNNVFIPGMSSGYAGLVSTLVKLYHSGIHVHYDATTIATLAVTGGFAVSCGILALICGALTPPPD